jgi:hypothetical protein
VIAMSLKYCRLDRAACASGGPGPIVRSRASLRAADSFFRSRARYRMPSLSHSSGHGPTFAVSRPRLALAAGCSQHDDYGMPCHWPFRRSRSSSRHGGIARLVVPAMPALGFAVSSSSTIDRSDFALLSVSLPPLLAWHSLGLKPCAQRLRPFCFAQLQRALRVSAPPATFPISRNPGSRKSCGPPEKARPQAWEQQPLALGVPKPNGQKRSN